MTKKMKTRAYMKAKALILWALLSAFILYPLQPAQAYEGELSKLSDDADKTPAPETPNTWGKWLYFDKGDYISVCGYTGTDGNITIPDNINGKPVTELSIHNTGTFEEPLYMFFEEYNENTSVVKVPEGVVLIDANTFYGCANLKSIDLPKSLLYIGENAFHFCEGLTSVTVPENVISIDEGAFYASGLTEIYLPDGLRTIGYNAFRRTPLTHISIPDSVTYIGFYAFESCLLEEITLPAGLAALETGLFSDCLRLKRVYVSEGTVSVMSNAFFNCSKLEEVYFPSTLRKADNVFHKNKNLKTVSFAKDRSAGHVYEAYRYRGEPDLDAEVKHTMKSDFDLYVEFYKRESDFPNIKDYSGIKIHYGEKKAEIPEEKSLEERIGDIFLHLTAVFVITFMIFLTLYLVKKRQNEPYSEAKPAKEPSTLSAQIPQGNILTAKPEAVDVIHCTKCGAESGKKAEYCYNCGQKLSHKKSKRKEQ